MHTYTLACSSCLWNVHCLLAQVLRERLTFLNDNELAKAFEGQRVLVNGCIATPTHCLNLTETVEVIFHRHEPEVNGSVLQIANFTSTTVGRELNGD